MGHSAKLTEQEQVVICVRYRTRVAGMFSIVWCSPWYTKEFLENENQICFDRGTFARTVASNLLYFKFLYYLLQYIH